MPPQPLIDFIKSQLALGISKDTIMRELVANTWSMPDIERAFVEAGHGMPPAPPAPPAAPAMPATPMMSAASSATPVAAMPAAKPFTQTSPTPPPMSTTPSAPTGLTPEMTRMAGIALVVVLVGAGVAYAYIGKLGPFGNPPYSASDLVSGLLAQSAKIESTSATFSASFKILPREAGAKPFTVDAGAQAILAGQYERDSKRANDISRYLGYLKTRSAYPATLEQVRAGVVSYYAWLREFPSLTDPSGKPYSYQVTDGGRNFALTATFEAAGAVSKIRNGYGYTAAATRVEGNTITFTKDSSSYLYVSSTPPKPLLASLSEGLAFLPPDSSGSISASAAFDKDTASSSWKANLSGEGDFGDLTYAFDIDALKTGGVYYMKINKIPSLLLGEIAAVKGQWLSYDPSMSTAREYNAFTALIEAIKTSETTYKSNQEISQEFMLKFAEIAGKDHLIKLKNAPHAERVDGRTLYRYDIGFDKAGIAAFYQDLSAVAADPKFAEYKYFFANPGTLDYLKSPEFSTIFDYYDANTTFTLWVDQEGFIGKLEYTLRLVPPDTAAQLKDKEVLLTFSLTTVDNQPVDIQAPEGAKSILELSDAAAGGSLATARAKSQDATIKANLDTIRVAAELYYEGTGNNSYGATTASCDSGMFLGSSEVKMSIASIRAQSVSPSCRGSASAFAVQAPLVSANGYWCIDSTGASKAEANSLSSTKCQ